MNAERTLHVRLMRYHTDQITEHAPVSFQGAQPVLWREAPHLRRDLNRTQADLTERFPAQARQIQNLNQVQVGYRLVLQHDDEEDPLAIYVVVSKMISHTWLTLGLEIDCDDADNYTERQLNMRVVGMHERCLVPVARFARRVHLR